MLQSAAKGFFHLLAGSTTLQTLASRYGMRRGGGFARRFIAGETVEEAIEASRAIQAAGLTTTLDYLGESVSSIAEADAATRSYLGVLDTIAAAGVERNISLKLTQLGLTVDRATCVDNLRRILDAGAAHDFFVRVDMENSPFTAVTFEVFETMWQQGYRNAGVVLQSCLPRSEADAAHAKAKTELLQIGIEEKKRTLVPVEAYDTMIDEFAGVVLSALGSLPARCAPRGDLATRRAIERAVWLSPCRDRNRRPADGRRERRAIRTSAAICSRCERARFRRAIRHRRAGGDQ